MFGTYFYHQRIRKSVAVFGSLFNNLHVLRKNSAGAVISQVKVPLTYAPKRDFIERLRSQTNGEDAERQLAIKLPRISFEIVNIVYDPVRQLSKVNQFNTTGTSVYDRNKVKTPVPYNINFQLNIYAKSQDDALQIVEQIVPYFAPQYTLTIKPFSAYADIIEDCPITLSGMSYSDDYEGAMDARRTIVYQLDFEMEANFYAGVANKQIIRKITAEQYLMNIQNGLTADSDAKVSTLTVLPNPLNVSADSDFGFTTTLTNHVDSSQ